MADFGSMVPAAPFAMSPNGSMTDADLEILKRMGLAGGPAGGGMPAPPVNASTMAPSGSMDDNAMNLLRQFGLIHRANGGPVDNNQSYLVGERGPEMVVPNQDGTVIPNELLQQLIPMWLQSAAAGQNQGVEPMTRALPGYESRDPAELAALRQSNTVRPIAGRAGEGPSVRDIFNATPVGNAANLVAEIGRVMPDDPLGKAHTALSRAIYPAVGALGDVFSVGEANAAPKPKAPAEPAPAGGEDPKAVMAEQRTLAKRGLYTLAVDGKVGPEMLAARAEAARQDSAAAAKTKSDEADIARSGASTAEATATSKKAEADLATTTFQQEGNKLNAKLEAEVTPTQRAIREYGPLAGYVGGMVGGVLGKKLVNAGSNKASAAAANEAESLFENLPAGAGKGAVRDKMTAVNEFWRGGGAKEAVPFRMTPNEAPGFAANEKVAPVSGLYAAPKGRQNLTDAVLTGAGVGDAGYFQFVGLPHAEEELKQAYAAAEKTPTDANLRRVQAAKDSVAINEMMMGGGRAFAGTYGAKTLSNPRQPTLPSAKEAELSRVDVEDWLRGQSAKSAAPSLPSPSAPSPPSTATTPKATRARTSDPARYSPAEFRQPAAITQPAPPAMPSLTPPAAPLALPAPARPTDEVLQEMIRRYFQAGGRPPQP